MEVPNPRVIEYCGWVNIRAFGHHCCCTAGPVAVSYFDAPFSDVIACIIISENELTEHMIRCFDSHYITLFVQIKLLITKSSSSVVASFPDY
jgi:hypothetical protein